jgi:hypothetical protein
MGSCNGGRHADGAHGAGHGSRIRRTTASRTMATAALSAAVLAGAAACVGASTPSGDGSGTRAATGVSGPATSPGVASAPTPGAAATGAGASAAAQAPTGGSSAGAGSGPGGGPGAPTSGAQAGSGSRTPACGNADIKVSLGRGGAAMSHDASALQFTNVGSHTCTLQGYPGAAVMNGSALVLDATRTLNGYVGDERQLGSAPLVTLAPGAVASAMLEWVGDAGEPCYSNGSGTLEVTPPNTTATVALRPLTVGPAGVCAGFEIHPVVPGVFTG